MTCCDDNGHLRRDEHLNGHQSPVVEECFPNRVARGRAARCEIVFHEEAAWCEQRDHELQGLVPRTAVEEDEIERATLRKQVFPAAIEDLSPRPSQRIASTLIALRIGFDSDEG